MGLNIIGLTSWLGIVAPTLYAGFTAQDSNAAAIIAQHAPPKVLAKQWLSLYQWGPHWVRPLIACGTLSHAFLVWSSAPGSPQRALYVAAAATFAAILPVTFLFFEPEVNGACKWKAQSLLRDEGFAMPPFNGFPSTVRHSASARAITWAEEAEMRDLVTAWGRCNHGRWIVALLAAGLSGWATLV